MTKWRLESGFYPETNLKRGIDLHWTMTHSSVKKRSDFCFEPDVSTIFRKLFRSKLNFGISGWVSNELFDKALFFFKIPYRGSGRTSLGKGSNTWRKHRKRLRINMPQEQIALKVLISKSLWRHKTYLNFKVWVWKKCFNSMAKLDCESITRAICSQSDLQRTLMEISPKTLHFRGRFCGAVQ